MGCFQPTAVSFQLVSFFVVILSDEQSEESKDPYFRKKQICWHHARRLARRLIADSCRLLYSSPNSRHRLVTCSLVFSSILISSGHGRVNPSLGHLRVASTPIFEPKSGSRDA
jgi:hypothetical protein